MILYHGSKEVVEFPEVRKALYHKDFYFGFYCTRMKEQAERWATRYGRKGYVNCYEYTPDKKLKYLLFEEMTEDAESNIDTENAQVYYTEIHGNTALVSAKADLTIVSWNEQNRILSVVFDGEVEEDALKVAKSVTRIK